MSGIHLIPSREKILEIVREELTKGDERGLGILATTIFLSLQKSGFKSIPEIPEGKKYNNIRRIYQRISELYQ